MNITYLRKKFSSLTGRISRALTCQHKDQSANVKQEYIPKDYWQERHKKYGFDLRGVGHCDYSHEENEQIYLDAKKTFLSLCRDQNIDFSKTHTLEIGCGAGLWTRAFKDEGGKDYYGVDITDTLFDKLKEEFDEYKFGVVDITADQLDDTYDLILMIDVTQHIVDEDAFFRAMENVYTHLKPGGTFIVTSWLTDKVVDRTFYEISRPMSHYEKAFPNCEFSEPLEFRLKYLFTISKKA